MKNVEITLSELLGYNAAYTEPKNSVIEYDASIPMYVSDVQLQLADGLDSNVYLSIPVQNAKNIINIFTNRIHNTNKPSVNNSGERKNIPYGPLSHEQIEELLYAFMSDERTDELDRDILAQKEKEWYLMPDIPAAVPDKYDLLNNITMRVTAEVGAVMLPLKDVAALAPGSVFELDRNAGEPIDLLVNGKLIGHAEVVVHDEKFAVRVIDIVKAD